MYLLAQLLSQTRCYLTLSASVDMPPVYHTNGEPAPVKRESVRTPYRCTHAHSHAITCANKTHLTSLVFLCITVCFLITLWP